ncbi:MAG: alanine:cation symporter family protein, partial [Nannocystaceae bacterium]|nr:alanine:cation symporter family protein [Nannocystaceae bacterium]
SSAASDVYKRQILICTMTAMVIIITGVWKDQMPTELPVSRGDMTFVEVKDDGSFVPMEGPPQEVVVEAGVSIGPSVAWHDAPVGDLYIDEGQKTLFSGTIDPANKFAVGSDGTKYDTLYGHAVESGAPLTMLAFRRGLAPLGDFGHHIVLLCVLLFGISTAISWSYYGDRCANYVFGPKAVGPYRAVFVLMHFLGAVVPLSLAWTLGDVLMGVVILPNLVALILLSPKLVELTKDYFERQPWKR